MHAPLSSEPRPRVVLDLEKLRHRNCGLGRFALHLTEGLVARTGRPVDFVLFARPETVPRLAAEMPVIPVRPWRKAAFTSLCGPLLRPFLRPPDYAVWHVTNQTSKYLPLDPDVPVVLTIHDLNYLHDARHRGRPAAVIRKLARVQRHVDRAAVIVTDSQWVANDVRTELRLGSKPLIVVPPGLAVPAPASAQPPAFAPRGPFFYALGNALAHKNFHVLPDVLRFFPDHVLVIAGKIDTPYGESLARDVALGGLTDRVIFPGQVSDGDRQWLYEHCDVFLLPSLTEGFGFPVLEAMHGGRPVCMSRRTSLPELGGDLGFYWDTYDPEHMQAVIRAALAAAADPAFGDRLRHRAASFSWQHTVDGYLSIYTDLIGRAVPRRRAA